MFDFTEFKKIIIDFWNKKIDRETFVKSWDDEQKRQGIEVKNAVFVA
ncbi:hypothetical protein [Treponema parvum]|nr:hypothetical protein [Treponema parvum]QTQ16286.1 hypothetical protein HXT04_06060 [Treponema parvum]